MNLYELTADQYPPRLAYTKSLFNSATGVFLNKEHLKTHNPDIEFGEFYIKRGKKTLLINVGESWVYGETLPKLDGDGGIGTSINNYDFGSQVLFTFGPKIAAMIDSDFYQYAVPGNNNSNMLFELDRILNYFSDKGYEKIYLIQQFTECNRDFEFHLYDTVTTTRLNDVLNKDFGRQVTVQEWITMYHDSLSDWYQDILNKYSNLNIDAIQWANFCDFETTRSDYSFKRIKPTWIKYSATLESIEYTDPRIFNAGFFLEVDMRLKNKGVVADLDFANQQLELLDKAYNVIQKNGSMYHNNHPNPLGHAVWATHLARQAGWANV